MNQISHFNQQDSEPAKQAIRQLYSAMAADYGSQFLAQFRSERNPHGISPDAWKHRLYKRVYGCTAKQIVDGYETLIAHVQGQRMPGMDDIVTAIKDARKRLQSNRQLHDKSKYVQSSGGISGVIDEMGKRNLGNPVAMAEISKIKQILADNPGSDADRKKQLADALLGNEILLENVKLG